MGPSVSVRGEQRMNYRNNALALVLTRPELIIHAFFLYKHHSYKHREPQIWPTIKHHLSTSLSLTQPQSHSVSHNTQILFVRIISIFQYDQCFLIIKIHLSYSFSTLDYSSLQIFKFLWLGYTIDGHKS